MQECKTCKITKNFNDFYIDRKLGDVTYYKLTCQACTKVKAAAYYQANKKRLSEQSLGRHYRLKRASKKVAA